MALTSQRGYARSRKARGLPGGTHKAVADAIAAGRIKLVNGKIDPEQADATWQARTDPAKQPSGKQRAPEAEDFFQARARKEVALANLREMDAAKRRSETLNATEVQAGWCEIVQNVRNRLLLIPDKVAPRVAVLSDVLECREVVRREIYDVLNALAATAETKA